MPSNISVVGNGSNICPSDREIVWSRAHDCQCSMALGGLDNYSSLTHFISVFDQQIVDISMRYEILK